MRLLLGLRLGLLGRLLLGLLGLTAALVLRVILRAALSLLLRRASFFTFAPAVAFAAIVGKIEQRRSLLFVFVEFLEVIGDRLVAHVLVFDFELFVAESENRN